MDDVTIKFVCGDSKEREAILERANREWAEIIHSSSGASYAWDAIADANEDLLVLEAPDGKLLGALSFCTRYGDEKNIYVSRIGVIRERCGYGQRLMREVAKIAADKGQGVVALPTAEGQRLFCRIGMRFRQRAGSHEPEYAFTPNEARRFAEGRQMSRALSSQG